MNACTASCRLVLFAPWRIATWNPPWAAKGFTSQLSTLFDPLGFRSILEKCLAFEPAGRYRSGQELYEDLDSQLNHRPLRHAHDP